jgi:plasmid stability protein
MMPSLQIRELPDDLYQRLALRARRAHRNLSQQALDDLANVLGRGSAVKRRALLERIAVEAGHAPNDPAITSPEILIREDRGR